MNPGVKFIHEGQPYVVVSSSHYKREQRRPVMQAKIKNLLNGRTVDHTFHTHHQIEPADIEMKKVKFVYTHRDSFVFSEIDDASKRFEIPSETIGGLSDYLKPTMEVSAMEFNDEIINIDLPIKLDYVVEEAPPNIKGDTSSGGTKFVTIETGAQVKTPLFINAGDVIKINTQTGEYVERVNKS